MRDKQTNRKFHRMEKEKGLEERTDKKKEVEAKNVGSLFSIFRSVGRTNVALFNKFN